MFVQRRCRLVQDQQIDLFRQRLGDFHQLLFAHAQLAHLGFRAFAQADLGQQFGGAAVGLVAVDDAAVAILLPRSKMFSAIDICGTSASS